MAGGPTKPHGDRPDATRAGPAVLASRDFGLAPSARSGGFQTASAGGGPGRYAAAGVEERVTPRARESAGARQAAAARPLDRYGAHHPALQRSAPPGVHVRLRLGRSDRGP